MQWDATEPVIDIVEATAQEPIKRATARKSTVDRSRLGASRARSDGRTVDANRKSHSSERPTGRKTKRRRKKRSLGY